MDNRPLDFSPYMIAKKQDDAVPFAGLTGILEPYHSAIVTQPQDEGIPSYRNLRNSDLPKFRHEFQIENYCCESYDIQQID